LTDRLNFKYANRSNSGLLTMPTGITLKCIGDLQQFSFFKVATHQLKRQGHVGT
jgi:hypothetical protein